MIKILRTIINNLITEIGLMAEFAKTGIEFQSKKYMDAHMAI